MPNDEDIDIQRELLQAHRRTLAVYLKKQALVGGAIAASVDVINGIHEARDNIRRIKATLGDWGVDIDDLPGDEAPEDTAPVGQVVRPESKPHRQGGHIRPAHVWGIVRWWTLATIAGSAVGYGVSRGPGLALAQRLIAAEVSWPASYMLGFAVMGALVGAGCGVGQWLVQRPRGWRAPWWAVVCVLAYSLGWGCANGVDAQAKHALGEYLGDMASWGLAGLVIGLTQWLAQPQHIQRAGWWILANIGAWSLGWTLGDVVSIATGLDGRPLGDVVIGVLGGIVGGAAVGVATGNILVGMVGPFWIGNSGDEGAAAATSAGME